MSEYIWRGRIPLLTNVLDVSHTKACYVYKWKNHFYEMKGDVGMSLHEKERNKKMPTPRHKVTHNPIPTSLFCFNMLFVCLLCMHYIGKANSTTQHLDIQLPMKMYVVVLEETKM